MNASPDQNQIQKFELTIPLEYEKARLDQTLTKLLPEFSRTQFKTWIDNGAVLINGKVAKANLRLKGGEIVTIQADIKPQPNYEAQSIPLNIVYEDEAVLLINKPAGLVVHPGAGNRDSTLLNALLFHCPSLKALPRAGILHRLDKDTTGLLLVAKNTAALKHLSHQLKNRTLLREYKTIVTGRMISGSKIDAPIDRHPLQRKRMAVVEEGKEAITHYRVAEKFRSHTLLNVKLETGRTHQIRVHMAYIHYPVVGDSVYGRRLALTKNMSTHLTQILRDMKRQALHAFALGFIHPVTKEFMRFEIDLPADMQTLLTALRDDLAEHKERN